MTQRSPKSFFYYLSAPFAWIGRGLISMVKPTQRGKTRWAIFAVIALAVISGFLSYPKAWDKGADYYNSKVADRFKLPGALKLPHFKNVPFKLGLDLQGGTHLVYEADTKDIIDKERGAALEGVRDVIERRVNAFGVSEPIVQTNKAGEHWRIIVELAGVRDVREAIRMIGETPILEFKEANDVQNIPLTADDQKKLDALNVAVRAKAKDGLSNALASGTPTEWEKLGPVSEAAQPDLWKWANTHQWAKTPQLVETTSDWNVVKLNARDTQEKEVRASHILVCFKGSQGCGEETTKEQALAEITKLRAELTPKNFAEQAKAHSLDPSVATNSGDIGWFQREQMVKEFSDVAFDMKKGEFSQPVESPFGYHLIYKTDERALVRYDLDRVKFAKATAADVRPPVDPWKNTGLSGKHIRRAQVEFDPTSSKPMVTLAFNDEGKKLFAEITKRNINKQVAIYLDGQAISIPRVQQEITEGTAVISGDFDFKEAKLLSQRLNAGALPVPIQLLSQQTIGASLGQDSLAKSLYAGMIGFLIVAAFMILYYRLPGLLAAVALTMYTAFTLAVFKLIGITLTLSGIAGVILSIGMAVDANILIFERIKEELRNGRPLDSAINEGFKRAWTSIRDSNVSSLLTCVILYSFTSSSVRGFAVTLALGILISMFSAITVTRSFLRLVAPWVSKHRWLFK